MKNNSKKYLGVKFTSPEFGQAAIDEARALHERGEIDHRTLLYATEAIKRIWYHTSALPLRYEEFRSKITGYKIGTRIFFEFRYKTTEGHVKKSVSKTKITRGGPADRGGQWIRLGNITNSVSTL